MDLGLAGKVALVTGGGRGIGRAEALALAREGADVAITFRSHQDEADETAQAVEALGRRALVVQADASDAAEVEASVRVVAGAFGRIDVLVNNAGTAPPGARQPLTKISLDHWNAVLATFLTSTFVYTKHVAPLMAERGWGRIVNTASILGRRPSRPGLAHYSAAKAGVIALTVAAARELARQGITVNAVAPGYIATAALQQRTSEEIQRMIVAQTPVGRLGTAEDVAAAVAFLASEQAGFITGAVFDVNGGRIEYVFPDLPS